MNDYPNGHDKPEPVTKHLREFAEVEHHNDGNNTQRAQHQGIHSQEGNVENKKVDGTGHSMDADRRAESEVPSYKKEYDSEQDQGGRSNYQPSSVCAVGSKCKRCQHHERNETAGFTVGGSYYGKGNDPNDLFGKYQQRGGEIKNDIEVGVKGKI